MDFYNEEIGGFPSFMRRPPVGVSLRSRFDEYYRCYPIAMGPKENDQLNYGGKVLLPASALEKLIRLHISYPMLFELTNGEKQRVSHAGVLEFSADEGKIYLPQWLMNSLVLEPGDLLQVKSTDLPPGKFVKLQAQSPDFLDISDPRAVLENVFRNFSTLTVGDVFTFSYNDSTYDMEVLEIKPENDRRSIVCMETDLSVDFAAPVGYEPPQRTSGTSTPRTAAGIAHGGPIRSQGTMAQSINYSSIAPSATSAAAGAKAVSSHFLQGGQRLSAKKGAKAPTPKASTPVAGASTNADKPLPPTRRTNGPQPLRLPPGKLFFGYELKPVKKKEENGEPIAADEKKPMFQGQGQTLRAKRKAGGGDSGTGSAVNSDADTKPKNSKDKSKTTGGRTLR